MGPAKVRPFIGKFLGQLTLSVAATLIATGLIAGLRSTPAPTPEPVAPPVASAAEQPHPDVHLASMQEAFAMSHLGAMRDEANADAHEPARRPAQDQKPRAAAAARPAPASKPAAPVVIAAQLPPVSPATAQPAAAEPAAKESSFFGFVPKLPSPGKLVDKVAALGDKITSLAPWR